MGHAARNYALAYFMSEHSDLLKRVNIEEVLHLYFQACSMTINTDGLAVLAATYATGGVCPITEDRLMKQRSAQDTISLMYNCGMYDYSGRFAFEVGIPAKSGVSGALFLSVPGKLGIGIYSPRIDKHGNSVRGLYVASQLVRAIPELHVFNHAWSNQPVCVCLFMCVCVCVCVCVSAFSLNLFMPAAAMVALCVSFCVCFGFLVCLFFETET